MALVIPINWSNSMVWNASYSPVPDPVYETGFVNEVLVDFRSPLSRTPKGPWRPPTNYTRHIESYGNTVDLSASWTLTRNSPPYRDYSQQVGSHSGSTNCGGYWLTATPTFPDELVNRAILKARLKVKNENVNFAQNLGEQKQVANMVVSTCKRLAQAVRAVRHLDGNAALNALGVRRGHRTNAKSPFELWLELQYGWKPLLSDVHAATTILSDSTARDGPPRITAKATAKQEDYFIKEVEADNCPYAHFMITKVHRVKHQVLVRIDFVQTNSLIHTAASLGLTNPLDLAWELLPFSFVVDWFVPVGDYLNQLDASFGFAFKGGSISKKTTMKTTASSVRAFTTTSDVEFEGHGTAHASGYQMYFDRQALIVEPFPSPQGLFKTSSSGIHAANGIALLAQAFGRHR